MSRPPATGFAPEHEDGEASAAASAPPAVSYYYSDAAKGALGPCLLTQLRVLWVSGHIGRDTSVWREGLGSWLPVHALPEVADALRAVDGDGDDSEPAEARPSPVTRCDTMEFLQHPSAANGVE